MAATSRMALGSIFGAITTLANTASNSLDAINDGVGMLNKTISDSAERQRIQSDLDMALFEHNATLEAAQQAQEFQDNLDDWMNSRDGRKEKFQSTLTMLQDAVKARRKQS